MARIVLGLATSHSPQLSLPSEHWLRRGEEDRNNQGLYRVTDGKHVTYEELLAEADPGIAKELTPEVCQQRYEANQKGIAQLAEGGRLVCVLKDGQSRAWLFLKENGQVGRRPAFDADVPVLAGFKKAMGFVF